MKQTFILPFLRALGYNTLLLYPVRFLNSQKLNLNFIMIKKLEFCLARLEKVKTKNLKKDTR